MDTFGLVALRFRYNWIICDRSKVSPIRVELNGPNLDISELDRTCLILIHMALYHWVMVIIDSALGMGTASSQNLLTHEL